MVGGDGMMCRAGSYIFMYYLGVSILYIRIFPLVLHSSILLALPAGIRGPAGVILALTLAAP